MEDNFTENTEFITKLVGVTFENQDGSNRQEIIELLEKGERLYLVREHNNQFDKNAIVVYNKENKQLGYLPSDPLLASHIDQSGKVKAVVLDKIGGKSFFDRLLRLKGKKYGALIRISKGDIDWVSVRPVADSYKKIERVIEKAYEAETSNPSEAIKLYQEAINSTVLLDSNGIFYQSWRHYRMPINRITMLLEKVKKYDEAYKLIDWYRNYKETYYNTIRKADKIMVDKRFERLKNRINRPSSA